MEVKTKAWESKTKRLETFRPRVKFWENKNKR